MVLPSSFALKVCSELLMEALALGRQSSALCCRDSWWVGRASAVGQVPSAQSEALAAAIRVTLQLPVEKLEQMGRAGAEQVAHRHDAAIELTGAVWSSIRNHRTKQLMPPH